MIVLPKNIFSLKDWKNAKRLNGFLFWWLNFERKDKERDEILSKAFEDYMSKEREK